MRGIASLAFTLSGALEEAVRILKAINGTSSAHLMFFKDFKWNIMQTTGDETIVGDPCTWIWLIVVTGDVIGWAGT